MRLNGTGDSRHPAAVTEDLERRDGEKNERKPKKTLIRMEDLMLTLGHMTGQGWTSSP